MTQVSSDGTKAFMSLPKETEYLHRSWSQLGDFYASFSLRTPSDGFRHSLKALERLCYAVERSFLKDQLFAHTSHANLMICQTKNTHPPSLGVEFLVIKPQIDPALEFSVLHVGKGEGVWGRKSTPGELNSQFNSVLRKLGWVHHDIF